MSDTYKLFSLVREGKLDLVRQTLDGTPSLLGVRDFDRPTGQTLLHVAAATGGIDLVALLVERGIDINCIDGDAGNVTPLCVAAEEGHSDVAKFLIRHGAYIDGADETIITPLMLAARQGHASTVKLLLEAGADVNRLGYYQRYLALDFAGWSDNSEVVQMLRAHGAISVTEDYDWEKQEGFPVLAHVSIYGGPVYPIGFERLAGSKRTVFRLAAIRHRVEPLFLFSAGLFQTPSKIDIGIALPNRWALLDRYRTPKSKLSFPLDILEILATKIIGGLNIEIGHVLSRNDPEYSQLGWPEDVYHLVLIDHDWKAAGTKPWKDESISEEPDCPEDAPDSITIATLAPVTSETFKTSKANVCKFSESRRRATWKKLLLPDPLFSY